jgi:hypothetical protein
MGVKFMPILGSQFVTECFHQYLHAAWSSILIVRTDYSSVPLTCHLCFCVRGYTGSESSSAGNLLECESPTVLWKNVDIRFIGLWLWYSNITITILDIIYLPVFYMKHNDSETEFCRYLQVVSIPPGTVSGKVVLYFRNTCYYSIYLFI